MHFTEFRHLCCLPRGRETEIDGTTIQMMLLNSIPEGHFWWCALHHLLSVLAVNHHRMRSELGKGKLMNAAAALCSAHDLELNNACWLIHHGIGGR